MLPWKCTNWEDATWKHSTTRVRGSGMLRRSVFVIAWMECSGGMSVAEDALRHRASSRVQHACGVS